MDSRKKFSDFCLNFVMLLSSLVILIPLSIMILGSFKTSAEADAMSLKLPSVWEFNNYIVIFQKAKIIRALINSVFVTTLSIIIVIAAASMAAFVIARSKRKIVNAIYNLFLLGVIIPPSLIAEVFVFKFFHIQGTYAALILHYVSSGAISMAVFMYAGFIKGIPKEIEESAYVEGCGGLKMFYKVILPLLQPISVTILIIISIGFWNDFVGNLFFLSKTQYWTLPMTVFTFFGLYSRDWNLVFANMIVSLIPITVLFFIFQRYIIAGMTAGAVKG